MNANVYHKFPFESFWIEKLNTSITMSLDVREENWGNLCKVRLFKILCKLTFLFLTKGLRSKTYLICYYYKSVLEGVFMIVESGFKCVGGKANIGLVRFVVISGYCSLIYDRFREALAEKWAFVAFSAVTFVSLWLIELHKDGLVVTVNGLLNT